MKRRLLIVLLSLCLVFFSVPVFAQSDNNEIVILYENDVHCAIDGYSKLSAMKNEFSESADYVGIISSGDYIQGGSIGAISQGEYIVNVMNMVGYDALTLGNHEFDYKLPRLLDLVNLMDTKPVCSNFQRVGEETPVFQPYSIVSYGDVDVAYIGVTTPDTLTSSSPTQFFDDNGEYAYTFHGTDLYDVVQNSIDSAENAGADYIVALSHLGTEFVYEQWSAQSLVKNTNGLDVVLDGHSHSIVENMTVADENGNDVIVSSTGTQFANVGKLTISNGEIKTELIDTASYEKTDEAVSAYIQQINEEYSELGERKIGVSKVTLTDVDEDGNRIIRNNETNIGDFCADAFRLTTGADIGFVNGGGIRASIDAGDVTFNDLLSVFPWNNRVCVAEVTGQNIVDVLELGVRFYPDEEGSFQHISGLTFDLNKSIPSSVKLDENLMFVAVEGERRVSNVKVLDKATGEYKPIDLDKIYTLASHNHLLLDLGGGASMLKDANIISDSGMLDVEMLEIYITEHLNGVIGEEYATSQNRINIVENKEPEKPTDAPTQEPEKETEAKPEKETEASEKTEATADSSEAETSAKEQTTSPVTGDNSNLSLWIVLMLISLSTIATVTARSKKAK